MSGAIVRTEKPSLLFLSQTLPYPPDSGVAIRAYHLLRLLSRVFEVTALCFYRRKGGLAPDDPAPALAMLGQFARVEAFPLPQEHSAVRLAWDHLRSVSRNRVYSAFTYQSRPFAQRLRGLLGERRFDLVHVDSIVLSHYFPLLAGLPVVCGHHNVESALLQRRASAERGWRSAYLSFQARLMEREERRWCEACTLNVTVSDADRAQLETMVHGARCAVVPNGVDTGSFRPTPGSGDGLVCVGEIGWFPNHDALRYFCEEILPRVRAAGHEVPVRWVGRAPETTRRAYRQRHGVELTGYVADIRPLVRDAACYVVPLRVGGGTRVKILDAWAMGKAVVSTSVGCEGLAAEDGRNILIRDDPDNFAQAVCAVLRDGALQQRLGAEGRRTVERLYDWERIGASVLASYTSLLEPRQPAGLLRTANEGSTPCATSAAG
jgi:glycosyltransferase involved in cell wall biosynthesis